MLAVYMQAAEHPRTGLLRLCKVWAALNDRGYRQACGGRLISAGAEGDEYVQQALSSADLMSLSS